MDIRKINGNELHGSKKGNGWEKCGEPVLGRDIPDALIIEVMLETEYAPVEVCSFCSGQKFVLGRLSNRQYLQCRDCGIMSHRPIENGIVMTSKEVEED
jgi:hypothetical protein